MLKSKFVVLRDVEDGALIRVNRAQVLRDASAQGSFKAQRMMGDNITTLVAHLAVSERGNALGATYWVESDCLVEVLLEDAA